MTYSMASKTQMAALFLTLRLMVHPVEMSVTVSVKQNSPDELPPSWPTRSISTNPGLFSLHSAQVRTGICDLSNVPGLVWLRPRGNNLARSGARWRSMLDADIETNRAATASVMTRSPSRRKRGTMVANMGARRLPAGVRVSIQQMVRAATTWEPNFGVRVARGRAILSVPARRMAARQWSRCQPVSSTSSSRILDFSDLDPRL